MIERVAEDGTRRSTALYSDCERYRYALTRSYGPGRKLTYVMLNPSKATELANDPTIERCERRARQLGYDAFRICNLFALRETHPERLKAAAEPEGPDNMQVLQDAAAWSDDILCAWGVHGAHRDQGARVADLLRATGKPLLHLGLTKHGHPRHPLYVSYKVLPQPWV